MSEHMSKSGVKTFTFEVRATEHGRLTIEAESFHQAFEIVEDAKERGVDLTSHWMDWSYSYDYTETEVDYNEQDNEENA